MASSYPQAQQPVHFFEGVRNITINDGQFKGVVNNPTSNSSGVPWLDFLLSHCAPDALVDSKARQDPPKCAPHTREAMQKEIIDWINLLTLSGLVMWLRGSAGSGKSAIAQTIAEALNDGKTPSASFFFSRISGSATRVDGDRLIPTIIYQLCLLLPEYHAIAKKKLTKDPSIFERSRGAQMAALFTKPLQQFSFRRIIRHFYDGRSVPLVIIIDGLDECRDPQVQCDILRIIADAAASIRSRPVRFFIASRPEAHITRTFDQHPNFQHARLRRINLDDDPDASMAILAFLRQEIRKIHETHPLGIYLDPSWPGQDIIDFLVSKSSPQFILASTAMLYVASPKHQPAERLTTVIDVFNTPISPSADQPLQRMDMLYAFIFSNVDQDRRDVVQAILGIIHLSSLEEYHLPPPTMSFLERSLFLPPGDVYLHLEPLVSVLHLPKDPRRPIKSMHASLFDFLLNPARSHDLVLDLANARAGLIVHYLLEDPEKLLSTLEDPAVQKVSFTPTLLKAAFVDQATPPKFSDFSNGNLVEKAHLFFTLIELVSKILRDPGYEQVAGRSTSHWKDAFYRDGCRDLPRSEHEGLIDSFRNPDTDQNCLFHLLIAYMINYRLDMTNGWQVKILEEVGRGVLEVSHSRIAEEDSDVIRSRWIGDGEALYLRAGVHAFAERVLKWVGSDPPLEARQLRILWDKISNFLSS